MCQCACAPLSHCVALLIGDALLPSPKEARVDYMRTDGSDSAKRPPSIWRTSLCVSGSGPTPYKHIYGGLNLCLVCSVLFP